MGAQQPDLRAHTILDSASGKAYFVLITLSEDKTDFEESSINLRVTDGISCWEREGMLPRASLRLCCLFMPSCSASPCDNVYHQSVLYTSDLLNTNCTSWIIISGFLNDAGLHRQPAPKDWMRNVYSAFSGSNQGAYEIQVQSSPDGLKVVPACATIGQPTLLLESLVRLPMLACYIATAHLLSCLSKGLTEMPHGPCECFSGLPRSAGAGLVA